MNPNEVWTANNLTGDPYDVVRIVALDSANNAIIVAPANEFGECVAVEQSSLLAHYRLTAAGAVSEPWETPVAEVVA